MSADKPTDQYLERHAEPEAREVPAPLRAFAHVAVIPALGEGTSLVAAVESVLAAGRGRAAVIVVLNARESDPGWVHAANGESRGLLSDWAASGAPITLIDRARPGSWLPAKQGVGLARKIGADVALAWRTAGRLESRFLQMTDADALVPPDWFDRTHDLERHRTHPPEELFLDPPAAACYPYRHVAAPGAGAAITLYEIWLRYHRLGLEWAGSPYAFQSIGSTLAVDLAAYPRVRGFPKTMAGEDFYLLDKLGKVGTIHALPGAPVRIQGRVSDRVPFGTGRAMGEMAARAQSADDYRLTDPRLYAALRLWLRTLGESALADGAEALPSIRRTLFERLLASELIDPAVMLEILDEMGAFDAIESAAVLNLRPRVRLRRLHTWFDAFRTLRLLHSLRDTTWPPVPWRQALAEAPFTGKAGETGDSGAPDAAEALNALQALDEAAGSVAGVAVALGRVNIPAITD